MKHRPSTLNTQQRTHEQPHITSAVPYAISTIQNAEDISVFVKYTSASLSGPPLHVETSLPVNWVSPSIGYESKPVGMNITRRPPQGLRPSQAGGFGLLQVPSATHSPAASHTAEQPVQRTHPSNLPTGLFHNSPARPFRAHGTVHHLPASEAIGAPRPHAQALVHAPAGPQRAPLRLS